MSLDGHELNLLLAALGVFKMATDLCARVSEVYLPGDAIRLSKEQECSQEVILLGPGLREAGKDIIVTKTGSLRMKQQPLTYWIDCHQRRVSRVLFFITFV